MEKKIKKNTTLGTVPKSDTKIVQRQNRYSEHTNTCPLTIFGLVQTLHSNGTGLNYLYASKRHPATTSKVFDFIELIFT